MVTRARRLIFPGFPRAGRLLLVLLVAAAAACDRVPLTAPTESTINLFATGGSVPVNGSVDIVATVTEKGGTPVQNGTVVTFTTTLGRVEPTEARTQNGRATVRLIGQGQSGTAAVTAFSGGATSDRLEIPIGAAAAQSVVLRSEPGVATSGQPVQLIAIVRDASGNPVVGVPVTFSANAGQLGATTVTTDAAGQAITTLTTTRQTEVRARAGGQEGTLTIDFSAGPALQLSATPVTPTAGQAVTFTISVSNAANTTPVHSATIDFGDGTQRSLGAISGSTTVSHIYNDDGSYTVTVRARDLAGQESTQSLILAVAPAGAIPVNISVSGTQTVGQPVTFTAAATPTSGSVERYEWNFGDGTRAVTTGGSTSHVYTSAGTKVVTVTVVGTTGATGEGRTEISIAP